MRLKNGDRVMPDPILVGRSEDKLAALGKAHGITRWTTNLDKALKNKEDTLFFDAATTQLRAKLIRKAIAAGKDIYCEKPTADELADALDLVKARGRPASSTAWCRTSCSCPACIKLKALIDSGFFGKILSVRGEFGYWVFEATGAPAQRPPGIIARRTAAASSSTCCATGATCSTTCSARSRACRCLGATHIPKRVGRERQALQGATPMTPPMRPSSSQAA